MDDMIPSFTNIVTLGKLPQFPHLSNKNNDAYFLGLAGLHKRM